MNLLVIGILAWLISAAPDRGAVLVASSSTANVSEECRKAASSPYEPNNAGGVALEEIEVDRAYRLCSEAARSDHATMADQYRLGRVAYVKESYAEAAEWWRKAADQGFAAAQNNLALLYEDGEGVPKDASLAAEWYRKAADQGDAAAQYNLALLYANGNGVPKDASVAAEWYLKASDQGDIRAQNNLGVLYLYGRGVQKDTAKALAYFEQAARGKNCVAMTNAISVYTASYREPEKMYLARKQLAELEKCGPASGVSQEQIAASRAAVERAITQATRAAHSPDQTFGSGNNNDHGFSEGVSGAFALGAALLSLEAQARASGLVTEEDEGHPGTFGETLNGNFDRAMQDQQDQHKQWCNDIQGSFGVFSGESAAAGCGW
jgi:TPR repeat protein